MIEFQALTEKFNIEIGNSYITEDMINKIEHHLVNKSNINSLEKPLAVQFEVTSKCNLNCLHCYNNSGNNTPEMSDSEWIAIAKEIISLGILSISLSGGEPFIKKRLLFDLLDLFEANDLNTVGIISNGWLIDNDIAKKLSNYSCLKWVQISIDGDTPQFHDSIRQKEGSWNHAIQAVMSLCRQGIYVNIAHTCNPKNYLRILNMLELAIDLGAKKFIYTPILDAGRAHVNKEDLILNEEQQMELCKVMEKGSIMYSDYITIVKGVDYSAYYPKLVFLPLIAALIRPDGKVKIDCGVPVSFGNLRNDTFTNIWRNKANKGWQNESVIEYVIKFLRKENNTIPYYSEDIEV